MQGEEEIVRPLMLTTDIDYELIHVRSSSFDSCEITTFPQIRFANSGTNSS